MFNAYRIVQWSVLGAASIKQYHVLNDRRHIVTKDSDSKLALYDVLTARKVKDLQTPNMEVEIKSRSQTVFVPNWFNVDLKIGVSDLIRLFRLFFNL